MNKKIKMCTPKFLNCLWIYLTDVENPVQLSVVPSACHCLWLRFYPETYVSKCFILWSFMFQNGRSSPVLWQIYNWGIKMKLFKRVIQPSLTFF